MRTTLTVSKLKIQNSKFKVESFGPVLLLRSSEGLGIEGEGSVAFRVPSPKSSKFKVRSSTFKVLLFSATLFLAAAASSPAWSPAKAPLMTRWASQVSPTNALPEYPRPQLVRPDWLNLNGLWDYAITPQSADKPASYAGKILVPFPVESAL